MSKYLDIRAIEVATGWKASYIYRLASRHQWRRLRQGRTVGYHWEDVQQTITSRRGGGHG